MQIHSMCRSLSQFTDIACSLVVGGNKNLKAQVRECFLWHCFCHGCRYHSSLLSTLDSCLKCCSVSQSGVSDLSAADWLNFEQALRLALSWSLRQHRPSCVVSCLCVPLVLRVWSGRHLIRAPSRYVCFDAYRTTTAISTSLSASRLCRLPIIYQHRMLDAFIVSDATATASRW